MREAKVGAPGFILIREMAADMNRTLNKVASLGYDGFEFLGFFGVPAERIRRICEDAKLTPYSCFIGLDLLASDSFPANELYKHDYVNFEKMKGTTPGEKVLEYIKTIGCEYISISVPNEPLTEDTVAKLKEASALIRSYGMKPQYHNHDFEYTNMRNGQYRMDAIMEKTDLLFEPDLGWMEIAGYDCRKALNKYADRIEIIHLKDYYRNSSEQDFYFRPTGYGVMDWGRILPICENEIHPIWYTADHDKAYDRDIYEELDMSLQFIKNALKYSRLQEE